MHETMQRLPNVLSIAGWRGLRIGIAAAGLCGRYRWRSGWGERTHPQVAQSLGQCIENLSTRTPRAPGMLATFIVAITACRHRGSRRTDARLTGCSVEKAVDIADIHGHLPMSGHNAHVTNRVNGRLMDNFSANCKIIF
jgi:hypothetical protein